MRTRVLLLAGLALLAAPWSSACADTLLLPDGFADSLVVGGFSEPLGLAWVPGPGRSRLLVIEQRTAKVRLVTGHALAATDPVGVVPAVRASESERGLLGVAVDPAFPGRPYLYTWSSSTSGFMRLSRFTLAGDLANTGDGSLTFDPASRFDLIADAPDQAFNHNGGALRFGPDGMLYVSVGDDASGCPAQDTVSLRGVILRLRVSTLPDGPGSATRSQVTPPGNPFAALSSSANAALVWAIGLRNPFRFHIDPADGALFVADVGENTWEELDRLTAGANAGWPWREGPAAARTCSTPIPTDRTDPIAVFDHSEGAAIMSLGVYRGAGTPGAFTSDYEGDVFYSDYYGGFIRRLRFNGSLWTSPVAPGQPSSTDWAQGGFSIADALVGPDGAIWTVRQFAGSGGEISRIVRSDSSVAPPPQPGPPPAALAPPAPNPATDAQAFTYSLPRLARVRLEITDVHGRRVRTWPAELTSAGTHTVPWDGLGDDGRAVRSGVYVVSLVQDGTPVSSRRFARIR